MRHFIYFKNPDYARVLQRHYNDSYTKNSEQEVLGITPEEHDVLILDAHHGVGDMADLHGLVIANSLLECFQQNNARIWIYSWFPLEYIKKKYPLAMPLVYASGTVTFYQLPLKAGLYE